jgi:hypothetical protein
MKAALSSGNTAIAVRGATTSVFITQKKVPVSAQLMSYWCCLLHVLLYRTAGLIPRLLQACTLSLIALAVCFWVFHVSFCFFSAVLSVFF